MFSAALTHTLEVMKQNMLPRNTIALYFLLFYLYLWEGTVVNKRNESSSYKFYCFYALLSLTPLAQPAMSGEQHVFFFLDLLLLGTTHPFCRERER